MFKAGDTVTINLIGGNLMSNATLLAWGAHGIMFNYKQLIQFMPYSSIWSVTKPAQEAHTHGETV